MSHYAGEISGLSEDAISRNEPCPMTLAKILTVEEPESEVEGVEGGISQSGTLEFLGIDNIHVMRDSEKKLKDICYHISAHDKSWLSSLDNARYVEVGGNQRERTFFSPDILCSGGLTLFPYFWRAHDESFLP